MCSPLFGSKTRIETLCQSTGDIWSSWQTLHIHPSQELLWMTGELTRCFGRRVGTLDDSFEYIVGTELKLNIHLPHLNCSQSWLYQTSNPNRAVSYVYHICTVHTVTVSTPTHQRRRWSRWTPRSSRGPCSCRGVSCRDRSRCGPAGLPNGSRACTYRQCEFFFSCLTVL